MENPPHPPSSPHISLPKSQRIGLFTGGGTAPGWNAVIHGATREIRRNGSEAVGVMEGWAGMLEQKRLIDLQSLSAREINVLLQKGGSVLGSSRTKIDPKNTQQIENMKRTISEYQLDGAIAVGGDDTLGQAAQINDLRVVSARDFFNGVPKTIDNDLKGTDRTFGFETAVQQATEQLVHLTADAEAQRRVAALEIMGRDAGWITLYAGYVGGADITLIPEFPIPEVALMERIREIYEKRRQETGAGFVLMAVAEGYEGVEDATQRDAFGHAKKGGAAKAMLKKIKAATQYETMEQVSGYDVRSRPPLAQDAIFAAELGATAGHLSSNGVYGRMVTLRDGHITHIPLSEAKGGRIVDITHYDPELMRKRDLPPAIARALLESQRQLQATV
ncbi:MAG: 6-phosphofructokinase [Candidatus Peribacteraceae bacterium]|nr:6-phosphofructokinase [Candidatus Peribacteraceae bacterium]MDD5074990.1 6-phosphofructokinase [Candidatus Peribacteraceae bacterium]